MNRVKEFRLQKKISQKELARKLGISPGYLNRIENDGRKLPFALALRIANELGCSMAEIFLQQKFTNSKRKENENERKT